MTSFIQPWIQSLLIIGRHEMLNLGGSDLDAKLSIQAEQETITQPRTTADLREWKFSDESPLSSQTVTRTVEGREAYRIADLCRDQPFWDALRFPASSRSLESLGNTVAVGRLPMPLPFILRVIACGQGIVSLQIEIKRPTRSGSQADTPSSDVMVFSSSLRSVELRPLKKRSVGQLGVATIDEHLAPMVDDEGLYFVTAKLNGNEAGTLPLLVRLEQ